MAFPTSKTRRGRVGHGIAQTLLTGNEQVVVVEEQMRTDGNSEGGGVWERIYDECRRFYNPEGISPTIPTNAGGHHEVKIGEEIDSKDINLCVETVVRVRRLTEKECWRLMGFDDEDFEKARHGVSSGQLYKQAGNSIVVNVLEAIFTNLKPYFV